MNCKFISPTLPKHYSILKCKAKINQESLTSTSKQTQASSVKFYTLQACKLGIARYPDFEYNAEGGSGTGIATKDSEQTSNDEVLFVSFDAKSLYIPALSSETTRFLGLPLPPFLKIEIAPEVFQGTINTKSGKIELEFRSRFYFSIGNLYKAPPLLVETTLTSEESIGTIRRGEGQRLDEEGKFKLVGVATVDPVNDFLLDAFLGLPTECIADLSAKIEFHN